MSLTPPDLKQCQAEKPNGHSFMTLGGVPKLERCKNKPKYLAKEKKPGADGQIGSMTLCESCKKQMDKQMPGCVDYETLFEISFPIFEATQRAENGGSPLPNDCHVGHGVPLLILEKRGLIRLLRKLYKGNVQAQVEANNIVMKYDQFVDREGLDD